MSAALGRFRREREINPGLGLALGVRPGFKAEVWGHKSGFGVLKEGLGFQGGFRGFKADFRGFKAGFRAGTCGFKGRV